MSNIPHYRPRGSALHLYPRVHDSAPGLPKRQALRRSRPSRGRPPPAHARDQSYYNLPWRPSRPSRARITDPVKAGAPGVLNDRATPTGCCCRRAPTTISMPPGIAELFESSAPAVAQHFSPCPGAGSQSEQGLRRAHAPAGVPLPVRSLTVDGPASPSVRRRSAPGTQWVPSRRRRSGRFRRGLLHGFTWRPMPDDLYTTGVDLAGNAVRALPT
jgi:hypothetical protein